MNIKDLTIASKERSSMKHIQEADLALGLKCCLDGDGNIIISKVTVMKNRFTGELGECDIEITLTKRSAHASI